MSLLGIDLKAIADNAAYITICVAVAIMGLFVIWKAKDRMQAGMGFVEAVIAVIAALWPWRRK